jgi:hypothetical protein
MTPFLNNPLLLTLLPLKTFAPFLKITAIARYVGDE